MSMLNLLTARQREAGLAPPQVKEMRAAFLFSYSHKPSKGYLKTKNF
jgi:hypothetical protein